MQKITSLRAHSVFACLWLIVFSASGAQIYVKQGVSGTKNGTSWVNAYTELSVALENVSPGDEIWLAAGTYVPTTGSDRSVSFSIPSQVAVFGGFAGIESSRAERDWQTNQTILSGDIGTPEDPSDNSFHVVRCENSGTLDGLIIEHGRADGADNDGRGGGLFLGSLSLITVINCVFRANHASQGGGVYCTDGSPQFYQTLFHQNTGSTGGGVYVADGNGAFVHCVFYGNSAAVNGAGVYAELDTTPSIAGCILWENAPDMLVGTNAVIRNSIIEGGAIGTNVLLADPLFVNPDGGDFSLQAQSPAIDAGADGDLPLDLFDYDADEDFAEKLSVDAAGNPRRVDAASVSNTGSGIPVDLGLQEFPGYEGIGDRVWLDLNANGLQDPEEDGIVGLRVNLLDSTGSNLLDTVFTGEDGQYQFEDNLLLGEHVVEFVLAGNRTMTVQGAGDDDAVDSDADPATGRASVFRLDDDTTTLIDAGVLPGVWYVRGSAASAGDGTSWETAFQTIEAALAVVGKGDSVWVAGGTYSPGALDESTYLLPDRIKILGGFAGTEGRPDERVAGTTTLLTGASAVDHLFTITGIAELDSLTLADGFADGTGNDAYGAAVLAQNGDLFVSNCVFVNHEAVAGTVYAIDSEVTLFQCLFYQCAGEFGVAVHASGGRMTILQSTIVKNAVSAGGAGVVSVADGGALELRNSIVWGNTGDPVVGDSVDVAYSLVTDWIGGTGNTNSDPLFADFAGNDFHLTRDSAAIDRGSVLALPDDRFDLNADEQTSDLWPLDSDGNVRQRDVRAALDLGTGTPPLVDLGIYEAPGFTGLGGRVWFDTDADGVQDAGEPAAGGVSVTLYKADLVDGSTVTASDGSYVFEGLVDALYEVEFAPPANRHFSVPHQTDDRFDSDVSQTSERALLQLRTTQGALHVDAGLLPAIYYVDDSGTGDGTSWDEASSDLSTILSRTKSGDEVWVASGVYTLADTRENRFLIPAGVSLYGGFNGSESSRGDRDWAANTVVFSGSVLGHGDGAKVVVEMRAASHLDGVTVEGGYNLDVPGESLAAVLIQEAADVTIHNCWIRDNEGATGGLVLKNATATLFQCAIVDNVGLTASAISVGGASVLTLTHCLLAGNTGGATPLSSGATATTNLSGTIVWGNAPAACQVVQGTASLSNVEQGWPASGSGNLNADPVFSDAQASDYQLADTSPLVDIGDAAVLPLDDDDLDKDGSSTDEYPRDLLGWERVVDLQLVGASEGAVDLGPLEFTGSIVGNYVWIDSDRDGIQDEDEPPAAGVTVSIEDNVGTFLGTVQTSSQGEYQFSGLQPGVYTVRFAPGSFRGFTIGDAGDDDEVDSDVLSGGQLTLVLAATSVNLSYDAGLAPRQLRVRPNGTGPSGDTWGTAVSLPTALGVVEAGDELWLAGGTYRLSGSSRDESFVVPAGVILYGGFAGTESSLEERQVPPVAVSILSGEMGAQTTADNAYHAVELGASSVLDYVQLAYGYADGGGDHDLGGGALVTGAGVVLRNCVVHDNYARVRGGGIHSRTDLRLVETTVSNNEVMSTGGGVYLEGAKLVLEGCTIEGNHSVIGGGGASTSDAELSVVDSTFRSNSAGLFGGAMLVFDSSVTVNESLVEGSAVSSTGGAVDLRTSTVTLQGLTIRENASGLRITGSNSVVRDCLLEGNDSFGLSFRNGTIDLIRVDVAENGGGGVILDEGSVRALNCRIYGNEAVSGAGISIAGKGISSFVNCLIVENVSSGAGGGVFVSDMDSLSFDFCTLTANSGSFAEGVFASSSFAPTFSNCILAGNSLSASGAALRHCLVDSIWTGLGNNNIVGTPVFQAPNLLGYRLQLGSPGIDAGDATAILDDVLDVDEDGVTAEPLPLDLLGFARRQDTPSVDDIGSGSTPLPDMGAYESGPGVTVGDFVWLDKDGDGRQEAGEPGLEGISLTFLTAEGGAITTVSTEADGSFALLSLPGDYSLRVTVPSYLQPTAEFVGSSTQDSNLQANGETDIFTLLPGGHLPTIDLGLAPGEGIALFEQELAPGWNLVSLPVIPETDPLAGVVTAGVWQWAGTEWQPVTSWQAQRGVFVLNPLGPQLMSLVGAPATDGIELAAGWNIVGPGADAPFVPVEASAALASPEQLGSVIWSWMRLRSLYRPVTSLEPGKGYWMFGLEP